MSREIPPIDEETQEQVDNAEVQRKEGTAAARGSPPTHENHRSKASTGEAMREGTPDHAKMERRKETRAAAPSGPKEREDDPMSEQQESDMDWEGCPNFE